jgi:hypothetical protein
MKGEIDKKYFDLIATELCRRVGVGYPPPNKINPQDYEWTQEEEDDFRKWLTKYLKSRTMFKEMGNKYIEKEVEWFIFQYGWKTKEAA